MDAQRPAMSRRLSQREEAGDLLALRKGREAFMGIFQVIGGTNSDRGLASYPDALRLTLAAVSPLGGENAGLVESVGRVLASGLSARVDCPSVDASLKDGYAVRSADIAFATAEHPIELRLAGSVAAGAEFAGELASGDAVRILSGARIPRGAEAVVSEEFASDDGRRVTVTNDAEPGRNILARGSDVRKGQPLFEAGIVLAPAQVGLLAAAGHTEVPVVRRPRVAIIATGDEVIAPGQPLREGQLFASNLVTLAGWCSYYGMAATVSVVKDDRELIERHLVSAAATHDAVLTSGGAWSGERDLVVRLLDQLGWRKVYHRVKMGPGKAVGFGLLKDTPVFCLPGGPPSNQMAFLQLALPGLLRLGGHGRPGLPTMRVTLAESVRAQEDWTQFVDGRFQSDAGAVLFHPFKMASRLQGMASSEGILEIPEGVGDIPAGSQVKVQALPCACIQD
jgi:molybdopterin molybdotransferase